MNKAFLIAICMWGTCATHVSAQTPHNGFRENIPLDSIVLSDPAILPDEASKTYYMTGTGGLLWKSKDLKRWTGPYDVIQTDPKSWMGPRPAVWAAELHKYKGKYYYFATFTNHDVIIDEVRGNKIERRASHVLVSDKPDGPYVPMKDPTYLPANKPTLDGTFWVDKDGKPYMVYCYEWLQNWDGTIEKIRLKSDLSGTIGKGRVLFRASDSPWSREKEDGKDRANKVTDGPWLFRTATGRLGMLWTSWIYDVYTQGVAYSTSGTLDGPWVQEENPITPPNYGHGMLFKTFEGEWMMSVHSHAVVDGRYKRIPTLFHVDLSGDKLKVGKQANKEVCVAVSLDKTIGKMNPIWAWFGYDEPNYTYMKDGKKLLTDISRLSPVPVYVRAHNLLTSGNGEADLKWGSTNVYTEDKKGRPRYHWNIVDSIFDTYVARGMHPLVQIGFMPQDLSVKPEPYRHHWKPDMDYNEIFKGWAYPPKDYNKWRELVYQWAKHCKERYGEKEVSSWLWEVWNEPNYYFKASFEEYCKLYDYAADGLRKALPNAIVGGPHSTDPTGEGARKYLHQFIEHCLHGTNYATGKIGSPLGYVGFHAKGSPTFNDGKVQMNIGRQLSNAEAGFKVIASYPELKDVPVIIGEFDPEGCAACSSEYTPQFNYRNGTMYSSTVADTYARLYELARKHGVNLIGAVTWAFEFENQPWFAGFRELATNGISKPVLNVFRMFGMMGGNLIEAASTGMLPVDSICRTSVRNSPDVGVLASQKDNEVALLVWNYHDNNDTNVEPASVSLCVDNFKDAERVLVTHYRVDNQYSNSYAKWMDMGSPKTPNNQQMDELARSSELQMYDSPRWMQVSEGKIYLDFNLPRRGVSLIKIQR